MTRSTPWEVGIVGTFDVENYGDLLFPLLAEAELRRRLIDVKLHRLSYHARDTGWPYPVTSLAELPDLVESLDGLLIGGGFIIRFDKFVAEDYEPPTPDIHHPTGYWLTPALIAVQRGIPVVWNAPGMHCNSIPTWSVPLLRLALTNSQCVRVRDPLSRDALLAACPDATVEVLPDTAFALPRLIDERRPSTAFTRLCEDAGLGARYIVIHALKLAEPYIAMLERERNAFPDLKILLLPIGPVLDDDSALLAARLPEAICLPAWPDPLLMAEILGHAQALIGYSYHLAITGLAFGVPVFCLADMTAGKYTGLAPLPGWYALAEGQEASAGWFLQRAGKRPPSTQARAAMQAVDAYWDEVADQIARGRRPPPAAIAAFWQDLPNQLETSGETEWQRARAQLARSEARVRQLEESKSMRLTAPLRAMARFFNVRKQSGESC